MVKNELYHHGIKGQRWGVRRFQNKDGTLINDGRKRYKHNELAPETKSLLTLSAINAGMAFVYKNRQKNCSDFVTASLISTGGAFVVEMLSRYDQMNNPASVSLLSGLAVLPHENIHQKHKN